MIHRYLADLVVVVHLAIGVFFLFGAPLALLSPWIAVVHVPLAIWVCAAHVMGWTCPLTPLENKLRRLAGEQGYSGSFVEHYLMPLVNGGGSGQNHRRTAIMIGIVTGLMNVCMYVVVVRQLLDD